MQTFLATSRMAVGLGFLTIPNHLATLFTIPFSPEAAIGCRMAGTRDFVLGALLYTCCSRASSSTVVPGKTKMGDENEYAAGKRTSHGMRSEWTDTQRALLAGIVVDALDVLACLWCYCDGSMPLTAALLLGGGAVLFCDIGCYCWYVQSKEGRD